MEHLRWSWLAAPYLACALPIAAVMVAAALIRGDRVLRLAMIGAAFNALPWAISQALAACTDDPGIATGLLRLGQGPVALVGPHLLILLLGVSGQLERFRWIARVAFGIGIVFLIACWATPWTVPGVQRLRSGMFYTAVGPMTGPHVSQLVIWLAVGFAIARRATPRSERRGLMRLVLALLVCGAFASLDTLLLYGIWGSYPIAFFPAALAASIAIYMVMRTDLVRPQGLDRGVAVELVAFAVAAVAIAVIALLFGTRSIALAVAAALAWTAATAGAWALARRRPVRVAGDRALDQFVARALQGDEKKLADRLGALWSKSLGIAMRKLWWRDGADLVEVGAKLRWPLDAALADWLVDHGDALAITDLATMRLGAMRGPLEALGSAHGATLIVPLVDRAQLVGLVEADSDRALREEERGLVAESARAAARGLTFFALARAASRERAVAREVEIADALRLQASASRDTELGRWAVAAEYRTAARTTGSGWSAFELTDGRLALLVTEAQAHGVPAALATAALTGAFAAATASALTLDELSAALQATAEGVMRGGEPVAAFFALLDANAQTIDWACAGHPGALLVGPIAAVDPGLPIGSAVRGRPYVTALGGAPNARATTPLLPDTLVVIGSRAVRGDDDSRWQIEVRDAAPMGGRLPTTLVEVALRRGEPAADLLAVVVRAR